MKRKKKCKTMDLPEGDEKLKQQKQWGENSEERERVKLIKSVRIFFCNLKAHVLYSKELLLKLPCGIG